MQLHVGRQGPLYYLIEWAGVDPQTGLEMIYDKDGKIVPASSLNPQELNAAKKPQYDKLPAPKFYGGIGNSFTWKDLSLSVFFSYRVGNYILDAGERVASYVGNISFTNGSTQINVGNLSSKVWDRWTTPGQVTDVPKLFYNDPANDKLRGVNTTRFFVRCILYPPEECAARVFHSCKNIQQTKAQIGPGFIHRPKPFPADQIQGS